jgi:uncharacterized protein YxeA
MTKLTATILITLLIAMSIAFVITHNNNMKLLEVTAKLVEENDNLKKTIDQNQQDYDWYLQRAQERSRLNGCYDTVQKLCRDSNFKDKVKCANTMGYVCQEM